MYNSQHIITSKHYLVMAALAFALGICLCCILSAKLLIVVFGYLIYAFTVLSVILIVILFSSSKNKVRLKYLLLPAFLIICTLTGMLRVVSTEYLFPHKLKAYAGSELWLSGTVSSPVTKTSKGYSYYFNFDVAQAGDEYISPETIVMYIPEARGKLMSEGDEICCWTKLSPPTRVDDTNAFDYYTHLRGRNIFYIGTTGNANKITLKKPFHPVTFIKDIGNFVKVKTVEAADGIVFDDAQCAAVLKGILVGDKSGFSDKLYDKFSNAGLSHIVAVSGMHLSVLFSVLSLLFFKARAHKKTAYLLSIPVIVLFVAAAQFTPSVCRSAIMMLVMIFATLSHQRYAPINALFFSIVIITMISPYAIFSKSLVLSFGATLGILIYFGYLNRLLKGLIPLPKTHSPKLNKGITCCKEAFCSSISLSFASFIGTAYFSALFFGRVSWIQFFTNLWIIPVVTLVFCMGFLACGLYYIVPGFATAVFYYPLKICLDIILSTAETFGKNCFSMDINNQNMPPVTFVAYISAAVIIYLILKFINDLKCTKSANQQ